MRANTGSVIIGVILGVAAFWGMDRLRSSEFEPHLESVECWFERERDWPKTECYYMHVPERHDLEGSSLVAFPVVRFKSGRWFSGKAPVLHLGAGGPGAPLYLDSTDSVHAVWFFHDDFSLREGRDLIVMDPRGSGLAKPLLTCQVYVDHVKGRWARALTREQSWSEIDQDYYECIDIFRSRGFDFEGFNSLSIARDVELLRVSLGVKRWVLVGVSYAATYAQVLVREFPDTVESLILDSATFPNLKGHHNYLENTLAPFKALFNYCAVVSDCTAPIADLENRLWALYRKLDAEPVSVQVPVPGTDETMTAVVTGDRFIAAVMEGIYGTTIFADLPKIIAELENRHTFTLTKYLGEHLSYLLDETYGDVSASAHYCYEIKPFTDFGRMRTLASELPEGYIRDMALFTLNWPDYCDALKITPGSRREARPVTVTVPTLFLQGTLDTVTRLQDVQRQRRYFPKSHLATFKRSHAVLGSEECAETIAARFVREPEVESLDLTCG